MEKSNFDIEREAYRDKIGKAKDAIEKLINISVQHNNLFDNDIVSKLNAYRKQCDKLHTKLAKNEFEIAIVGLEKNGKSTFGNALMGNNVLPNADERCTYTSTCIRYGQDRAKITFLNASEVNEVLRGYLRTLGISEVESHTLNNLTESYYQSLFQNLDPKVKSEFENNVHQDVLNLLRNKNIISSFIGHEPKFFENDELNSDEFKEFIINPSVSVAVKEVCIESSKIEKMSNAIIYDVPGFDSPTSMHLDQTRKRMKEADVIMLIGSADKPSFNGPSLSIFKSVYDDVYDEDSRSLKEKMFIFANKADAANTLAKNISTLKSEALKWNFLDPKHKDERVVVGSAKAHLQKLGVIPGTDCIDKFSTEEYKLACPDGDGIDLIYKKLVKYNETERFNVLKKRVQKTIGDLKDLFSDIRSKNDPSDLGNSVINGPMIEINTLLRTASKKITNDLKELRHEIRKNYRNDLVLSKRLQSEVTTLFSDKHIDKYLITDEDIKKAIEDAGGSGVDNVERAEQLIREKKYTLIYNDFSNAAFSVAHSDHSVYYNKILDIFTSALNIDNKSSNYDLILSKIKSFVDVDIKISKDNDSYESLIERFASDLIEVLISRPYGSEARLNKFIDDAETYSGLIMFYNDGDADSGYRAQFLSIPPKNQPLLLALIFHDYSSVSETCRSFLNSLNECVFADKTEFLRLGLAIIKRDPVNGLASVNKKFQSKANDEKTLVSELRNLEKELKAQSKELPSDNIMKYDFDCSNREDFEKQYKQFFGNMPVKTYENISTPFRIDLDVLKDFLVHASIPAIRLEKPFVAREVQSISNLLKRLEEDFGTFITKNASLLLPEAMNNLSVKLENIMANNQAISEIEDILKTLNE